MNYRDLIKREFEKRSRRNPAFSLRAFSKLLGVSPSTLSEMLNGVHVPSRKKALQIAEKLGLDPTARELFLALVDLDTKRSPLKNELAKERLKSLEDAKAAPEFVELQMDYYATISDWYHQAILQLTELKTFKADTKWIAKRLALPELTVKTAIERLLKLELLEVVHLESGRATLKKTKDFIASPSGIPSGAIREHHRQILEKATASIEGQSIEERDLSTMVMTIDRAQLPRLRETLKKFRRRFCASTANHENKDSVYCLSMQFFKLEENHE